MSYQYYLQHMQQLMALGYYNTAGNYPTIPYNMSNAQNLPIQLPAPRNSEPINIESSDEENDVDERSLFCANLAEKVTEELLYEVFLQAGPLEKVNIPKDNNGKQRSYGFVTYKYRSSITYALRLYQGLVLYGKRLDIKFQGKMNGNCYNKR